MLRTLTILALSLTPLLVSAAIDARRDPWLQVDVLLFRHGAEPAQTFDELWAPQPPLATPANAVDGLDPAGSTVRALQLDSGPLAATAERMTRSGQYRVLLQESLQMPKAGMQTAPQIRLHSGQALPVVPHTPAPDAVADAADMLTLMQPEPTPPPLAAVYDSVDGWAKVWIDTFIFLQFDLTATEPLSGAFPSEFDFVGEPAYADTQIQQYHVADRRRVRYEEVQYFDHPEFGVLLYIREIPEPGGE